MDEWLARYITRNMSARSATPRYLFLAQTDLFVNILIIAAGAGANQSPNPLPKEKSAVC